MRKVKPERWIVLPDIHLLEQDHQTLLAVESYMKDHKWDGWIQLGDLLDFNEISRWTEGKPRLKKRTIKDYFDAGKEFLDRHRKIVGKKCQMVLIQGNHEERIENWLDSYPKFEGMLEVENLLGLDDRNIKWIKNSSRGEKFKNGNACFIHGRYTNKYHANKHAENYGVPVYYGHTHTVQEIARELEGEDKTIVGKSLGCLCNYKQSYLKGRPTSWQQAFAVFYFFPDGFYTEHTIRIFKHRFYAEGKMYDGVKLAS